VYVYPVGFSNLYLARQRALLESPRMLQFGVGASLLAVRLRRRVLLPVALCVRPTRSDEPPPPDTVEIHAVDREWPSDRPPDRPTVVVEEVEVLWRERTAPRWIDLYI